MCLVRSSRVPGRGRMLLGFHTTLELLHHLRARTSISPTGGLSRRQHICMRRQHKSTHANTRQLQTCVQALKSRLVLKAKQSSMARYLSSHPERRMTLSTTWHARAVRAAWAQQDPIGRAAHEALAAQAGTYVFVFGGRAGSARHHPSNHVGTTRPYTSHLPPKERKSPAQTTNGSVGRYRM